MKKKILTILITISVVITCVFVLTACGGDKEFFGIYSDPTTTIEIDKNGVAINNKLYSYNYNEKTNELEIDGYTAPLSFYEQYKVLSFNAILNFDKGSISQRDGEISTSLYTYGNGGILEAYNFNENGTYNYINSLHTNLNSYGTYKLKNGVMKLVNISVFTLKTSTSYWYIADNGEIHYGVYLKDREEWFKDADASEYKINYSVNNSDYGYITGSANQSVETNSDGDSVTAVAKDGFKFVGWSDGVLSETRQEKQVSSDINVVAIFEKIQFYTVAWYNWHDGEKFSINVEEGAVIKLPEPTRTGYTFAGYTFDGWDNGYLLGGELIKANECLTITQNVTLYPRWTINTYNIVYHLGDCSLENEKISFTINDLPYNLPTPITQGELSFAYWSTDAAGKNKITQINELKDYEFFANCENSSEFLSYTYNEELGGFEVSNYTGNGKTLTIPSTYQNLPVVGIADCAFYGCSWLTNISIPNSIISIDVHVFDDCVNLQYNMEGNLKYLGNNENNYFFLAGTTSKDITSATINNNCKIIGPDAFFNCTSLTSSEIPNGVISIGGFAFAYSSLASIEIPSSVTSIGIWAFFDCLSLAKVNYLGNADQWVAINFDGERSNPLINSGCKLYLNNQLATEIKLTTDQINDYSFYNYSSLTSVTFEGNNTNISIGTCSFCGCTAVKTIIINRQGVAGRQEIDNLMQSNQAELFIRKDLEIPSEYFNVCDYEVIIQNDGVEYFRFNGR